ncbi:MAG: rod shape-determining protein [Candidatus Chisholmbacteria bacterium RIFCSPLOWO2_01_FULL_50_28]|uniref:Cell shape-determining protein MreB n=1 Tax=Candidatus Chisholmbacteria bacterium RIFCSPHIGHO2_01_FULL_52_32 TaxID=1797591 RepID=A0A1G1VS27_9BACT|nr:MAG: rod shape-determining protein [Candidatus Chisholmbacteria bacterium RIFCSPHIGHO2_01_FULL_52_32]OGY20423.1 MAG: rod shape-determining protein [Candidatus Chisholmbacteria bacterium RIFCSPLOWO2_01_FULL_50_28]
MFNRFFGLFSHDIGIDLGTANTLVLVRGKGIVVREPSVVARHKKTGAVLAIGTEAKLMVGKTPQAIEALRPLRDGVIADFDAAEAMLSYYIRLVHETHGIIPKIPRPRVVVGIPSGVTEVERRAVQEVCLSAGAREAYLIEEPMAAAIGAGLPIEAPQGHFIVDIGGGTTEIAVISLGGIVLNRSIRIAGDELDEAVQSFVRLKFGLLLGLPSAEEVKIAVGSAYPFEEQDRDETTQAKKRSSGTLQIVVRGRDLETGLPKSLKINSFEVREALSPVIRQIIEEIKDTLEETPPELIADVLEHGITMAGGSSLLRGIDRLVSEDTKMPVWVADDPQTAVVRGCGMLLEDARLLSKVRVRGALR